MNKKIISITIILSLVFSCTVYGQEKTKYDNYIDFDTLMHQERDSQYEYVETHNLNFVADDDYKELRVSLHYSNNETPKYFKVYDSDGHEINEYATETMPGEVVIVLRNITRGDKYSVSLKMNGLEGQYFTLEDSGTYEYDPLWVDNSVNEFDAFGYYNYTEEVYRSLMIKDNITLEDMEYLLSTYPLIPENSLLKREGVASAFIKVQEEYGVSALGLLAIACLESAYGTSRIAIKKQNLFGWGAVDTNPYNGAWDWNAISTRDAIYKALSLITTNYPVKHKQICFYTMRWNNGIHQYCTSTTWPNSNAVIRAQFETYLGLR